MGTTKVLVIGKNSDIGRKTISLLKRRQFIVEEQSGHDLLNGEIIHQLIECYYIESIILFVGTMTSEASESIILPFTDLKNKDFLHSYKVNYWSAVLTARLAKMLFQKKGGTITFISSSSSICGRKNYSCYSPMKAALINLTQCLAEDLKKYNIRVNCLNPASVNTKMRDIFEGENWTEMLQPIDVAHQILPFVTTNDTGVIHHFSYHHPNFYYIETMQTYIRFYGAPDFIYYRNMVFTMDFYDEAGLVLTYGNKKHGKMITVKTVNRYSFHSYSDAVVEISDATAFRHDIEYRE